MKIGFFSTRRRPRVKGFRVSFPHEFPWHAGGKEACILEAAHTHKRSRKMMCKVQTFTLCSVADEGPIFWHTSM